MRGRFVFIDETRVTTNLTRLRGRAPCAVSGSAWTPRSGDGGRRHSSQGLIGPWVIKGVVDGDAFAAYIRDELVPELKPGTVVIMDNFATYRDVEAAKAIRAAKYWFLYLPPSSPDLNPIEQAFAKLIAHLRKVGSRTFTALFKALGDICKMFTPEECWNYLHAAGYVSA